MTIDPKILDALNTAVQQYLAAVVADNMPPTAPAAPAAAAAVATAAAPLAGLTGDAALAAQEAIVAQAQASAPPDAFTIAVPASPGSGRVRVTKLVAGPPPLNARLLEGGDSEEVNLIGTGFTADAMIVVARPDGMQEGYRFETVSADGTQGMFRFMAHGLSGTFVLKVEDSGAVAFVVRS